MEVVAVMIEAVSIFICRVLELWYDLRVILRKEICFYGSISHNEGDFSLHENISHNERSF